MLPKPPLHVPSPFSPRYLLPSCPRGEVALDSIYLADQDGNMVTVKVWEGLSVSRVYGGLGTVHT